MSQVHGKTILSMGFNPIIKAHDLNPWQNYFNNGIQIPYPKPITEWQHQSPILNGNIKPNFHWKHQKPNSCWQHQKPNSHWPHQSPVLVGNRENPILIDNIKNPVFTGDRAIHLTRRPARTRAPKPDAGSLVSVPFLQYLFILTRPKREWQVVISSFPTSFLTQFGRFRQLKH